MDGQNIPMADSRFPVPDGFRQLLEALAREVLRGQPNDIYAFSALFFKILLEQRKELNSTNPLEKPEQYDKFKRRLFTEAVKEGLVARAILSSSSFRGKANFTVKATTDIKESPISPPDVQPQAQSSPGRAQSGRISPYQTGDETDRNRAATKIQANIRGFLTRKRYKAGTLKPAATSKPLKRPVALEDKAASKIQAGVRGYLTRRHLEASGIPIKSPTRSTRSSFSGDTGSPKSPVSDTELAAAKIQAGVRGYLTRKHLSAKGVPVRSPSHRAHLKSHQKSDAPQRNVDEAAAKIQAGVRGFLTRKHLEQQGLRKSSKRNANKVETRRVTIANVDDAATKIQAGVRGFLTRKRLEAQGLRVRSGGATPSSSLSPISPSREQQNHIDADIDSPGAEAAAATKIQAVFRGHKVRQQHAKQVEDQLGNGESGSA